MNSFQLGLGPVSMSLRRFFTDMPIRYTLRAAGAEEVSDGLKPPSLLQR
jgi:hypothetical protein